MNSDTSIETSEDEARPYRRDPDMDGMATPRGPVDANDLERMAKAHPHEYFLKGSGVLKLLGAIRDLETQREQARMDAYTNGVRDERMSQKASSQEAKPVAAALYVECRECSSCGHAGLNDAANNRAACNTCGWIGPEPKEDKCPDCHREGTMSAACPKCGERYHLLAEQSFAAPQEQAPADEDAIRNAALEEAALICDKSYVEPGDLQVENCHEAAAAIRSLQSQPQQVTK